MSVLERLSTAIRDDDALRLSIAKLMLDTMGDEEAWFDLGEEACVKSLGSRVPCPHCGESTGAEVFRGMDCYECGELVEP